MIGLVCVGLCIVHVWVCICMTLCTYEYVNDDKVMFVS